MLKNKIIMNSDDETILYATNEIDQLMLDVKEWDICDKTLIFNLEVDQSMKKYSYSVSRSTLSNEVHIILKGQSSTEVLHGVYFAFEKMGFVFDISGPIKSKILKVMNILETEEIINPSVLKRGISTGL